MALTSVTLWVPIAAAQSGKTVLAGLVYSGDSGEPIEAALIQVLDADRSATSDASGYFRIENLAAGTDSVEIRYMGFQPNRHPVTIVERRLNQVVFLLTPTVLELAAITVKVEPLRPTGKLARFEERRRRGFGHFFTLQDIEAIKPVVASDVLRRVPGVIVSAVRFGRSNIRMGRGRAACSPFIYLDGMPMPAFELDDIAAIDILAMEVYSGISTAPIEFSNRDNSCGVIVVWTQE